MGGPPIMEDLICPPGTSWAWLGSASYVLIILTARVFWKGKEDWSLFLLCIHALWIIWSFWSQRLLEGGTKEAQGSYPIVQTGTIKRTSTEIWEEQLLPSANQNWGGYTCSMGLDIGVVAVIMKFHRTARGHWEDNLASMPGPALLGPSWAPPWSHCAYLGPCLDPRRLGHCTIKRFWENLGSKTFTYQYLVEVYWFCRQFFKICCNQNCQLRFF